MIFADIHILYFLALVPLLVLVFIAAERSRRAQIAAIASAKKPGMVMGAGFERRLIYLIFLSLGIAALVFAAARPRWGVKLEQVRARGIDVLIAVDVSDSMRATDVAPDRMSRARQQVERLLGMIHGDRIGLVAFAGSAYSFCPLTVDYSAVRLFLGGLEPGVISDGGTNVPAAIDEALKVFERSKSTSQKVLVIFSDGENHETDPLPSVEKAVAKGVRLYTVGIGSTNRSGGTIPLGESELGQEFKKDSSNNLIISRLDEATLQAVAKKGNGAYYLASENGLELVQIYKQLQDMEKEDFSSKVMRQHEERYQIPLAISLFLLVIAYAIGHRSFKKLRRTQEVTA